MAGIPSVINLGALTADTRAFRMTGVGEDAWTGLSVASAGDLNRDGYDDVVIGAPFADAGSRVEAGVTYVVFGRPEGNDDLDLGALGTRGFRLLGASFADESGAAVASAGDLNGDGYDDLVVGAPSFPPDGASQGGSAAVILGRAGTFSDVDLAAPGAAGFRISGAWVEDAFGTDVAAAGDVNGDGVDDLIVGASRVPAELNGAGPTSGAAYVVFGRTTGFADFFADAIGNSVPGLVILGVDEGDRLGGAVSSAGDVNGDGLDDLLVGASGADNPGEADAGSAWVVFGRASGGTVDLATLAPSAGFRIRGAASGDETGVAVAGAGDLDGDGYDEIIVGAYLADPFGRNDAGAVYVIRGKASGFADLDLGSLGTAGFRIVGAAAGDIAGISLSSAGDVNGDGFLDLLVGAPSADPGGRNIAGSAYVLYGGAAGFSDVDLAALPASSGFRVDGAMAGDFAGRAVASAGDVDGDGYGDLIIGTPFAEPGGVFRAGGATVIFGEATAAVVRTAPAGGGALYGGDFNDRLTGLGGADRLVGRDGRDSLVGGGGNDTLDGGAGLDTMAGGLGNDTYVVDLATDVVSEAGGGGRDLVIASVTFALGNGLEDLTLAGAATRGTGNAGANVLTGHDGANTLSGGGGADSLSGGGGADSLSGGGGADSLDGGTGNDRLSGGLGDDIYRVDAAGDVVLEAADGGSDIVYASVTFTLGLGLERLILTGNAAINGTGNNGANRITGNAAANRLEGGAGLDTLDGGAGADTLLGGAASDLYVVDNIGDVVSEAGGSGRDRVLASVSFTLGTGVEELVLTGTAALAGTGSAGADRLTGNAGANLLSGLGSNDILLGGAGNDTLVGGVGADRLYGEAGLDVIRYASAAEGADLIFGFDPAEDRIQVSAAGFGGLTAGNLPAARFAASASGAATAPAGTGQFTYDTDNGRLFWDANGSGTGGATLLATLVGAPALTAADFTVIA